MRYRYEPLKAYLSSIPEPVVVMTYDEIEKLLGRKLPNTAYGASWRQWWANTETHSQALAWLRAGWRVTRPDFANKRVEFQRQTAKVSLPNGASNQPPSSAVSGSDAAAVPGEIVLSREHLTPSALRMVEDAAEDSGGNLGLAVTELLNRAAMARRRQLLDWFAESAPRSGTSSVELIREDRDAR
jgi:hypothetical protein